jgi:hypothetical protein
MKNLFTSDGPLGLNLLNLNRGADVLSWHSNSIITSPGFSLRGSITKFHGVQIHKLSLSLDETQT